MPQLTFSQLSLTLFILRTCSKILQINLEVPEAKSQRLMKQSTFQGAWRKDRKAANDSDKKVTHSNCSMKKLTDARMEHLTSLTAGQVVISFNYNMLSLSSSVLR